MKEILFDADKEMLNADKEIVYRIEERDLPGIAYLTNSEICCLCREHIRGQALTYTKGSGKDKEDLYLHHDCMTYIESANKVSSKYKNH